jgi:transposase-like protein
MSVLSEPRFHDPLVALEHVETALWPNGPVCPHCGATDRIYTLKGKSTKPGVRKCGHCLKLFTVTVGTIFESSHVPMRVWLQAITLMVGSKKGISSNQLHRTLGVTLKTAWFMSHRIREAMRDGSHSPLGGVHNAVEADETFIGRKEGVPAPKGGYSHKHIVLGLVERGGKVRSAHIDTLTSEEVGRHHRPERMQLAVEAGAKRILIPSENKRDLADVPDAILTAIQWQFYDSPTKAAIIAMGMN